MFDKVAWKIGSIVLSNLYFLQDARNDIKGAIDAGLKGILVKTGKYREADEKKFSPSPTKVCESFSEAVDYIIEEYNLSPILV